MPSLWEYLPTSVLDTKPKLNCSVTASNNFSQAILMLEKLILTLKPNGISVSISTALNKLLHTSAVVTSWRLPLCQWTRWSSIWMMKKCQKLTWSSLTFIKNHTTFSVLQVKSVQLSLSKRPLLKNPTTMNTKVNTFSCSTDLAPCLAKEFSKPSKLLFCSWCPSPKILTLTLWVLDQTLTDFILKAKNTQMKSLSKQLNCYKASRLIIEEQKLQLLWRISLKKMPWKKDTKNMWLFWLTAKFPILNQWSTS